MKIWRCDLVPQYEAYSAEINEAIQRVLKTGRYILATEVNHFEKEFAEYLGVKHVIGVANATDALILAMKAINIGAGDEVITSPYTAIPTVSAIIAAGAKPIFVDIDPETFLIDIPQVVAAITDKTKAIMPVHIFGNVVNIPELKKAIGNRVPIIEDSAQAHGSKLNGVMAGTMGEMGIFSFYPTKNLGGYGDGGAVVTNDDELADKLRKMRYYGMIDKDTIVLNGVNSRLDEIQAAILRVKLRYLDEMNEKRHAILRKYQAHLPAQHFTFQKTAPGVYSCLHVLGMRFTGNRDKFLKRIEEKNVEANVYYKMPLYRQKPVRELLGKDLSLPRVDELCKQAIALPFYPELLNSTQDRVIEIVRESLKDL